MNEETRAEIRLIATKSPRHTRFAIYWLALVISFSLAASAYGLYSRFTETNERRTEQQAVNTRFERLAFDNCVEIEKLKTAARQNVIESFRGVDRVITDAALARFAKEPCPRRLKPK